MQKKKKKQPKTKKTKPKNSNVFGKVIKRSDESEQFPDAGRGERESSRCVNVFFHSNNLSLAQPQKQRQDEKRARITQTKFANDQLDPLGPPALVKFTHASLSLNTPSSSG